MFIFSDLLSFQGITSHTVENMCVTGGHCFVLRVHGPEKLRTTALDKAVFDYSGSSLLRARRCGCRTRWEGVTRSVTRSVSSWRTLNMCRSATVLTTGRWFCLRKLHESAGNLRYFTVRWEKEKDKKKCECVYYSRAVAGIRQLPRWYFNDKSPSPVPSPVTRSGGASSCRPTRPSPAGFRPHHSVALR